MSTFVISNEEFYTRLSAIAERRLVDEGPAWLFATPGVLEALEEELYDEVLDEWQADQSWSVEHGEDAEGRETLSWKEEEFELILTDLGTRTDSHSHVKYQLFDGNYDESDAPIFEGTDLAIPLWHDALSLKTIETAIGFFSLEDGDTDKEYFDKYTKRQLAWRDKRAEELHLLGIYLQELMEKAGG